MKMAVGDAISGVAAKVGALGVFKDMIFGKWNEGNPDLKVSGTGKSRKGRREGHFRIFTQSLKKCYPSNGCAV